MLSRIAAHLILGPREEPFLAALLDSLRGACESVLVNDNSPEPSPHARTLAESAFAREGALVVDRTPFTDFAAARNVCIRLHHERDAGEWMLFVDADEVHGPQLARIANNLASVPPEYDFVDGYTWHFFQSFDWYRSIERAKTFIRMTPDAAWEGAVHEKLHGPSGKRIALPYVFAHYGWVLPIERQAQKERLYATLGRPGAMLPQHELDAPQLERSFAHEWATVLRFHGSHPPAAAGVIERLRGELAAQFAAVDEIVPRHQDVRRRVSNALMRLNYEQRWRLRAFSPPARRLLA
ncbi:MAG TPA: glycosyltransferase [Candidatus Baltobacteraceae bacterium]|nr:glycosyltransferase [Candidatus Baltobacteraceae bacterium]